MKEKIYSQTVDDVWLFVPKGNGRSVSRGHLGIPGPHGLFGDERHRPTTGASRVTSVVRGTFVLYTERRDVVCTNPLSRFWTLLDPLRDQVGE